MTKEEKKGLAKRYFLNSDLTQKEIAELVGVSEKTLSIWVNDEDDHGITWHEEKTADKSRSVNIRLKVLKQIDLELDRDTPDADKLSKLKSLLVEVSDEKVSAIQATDVVKQLIDYVLKRDHELGIKLMPHIDNFVKDRYF
jgi:transcriptional regulator with XRE-family HTH domain